MQQIKHDLNFYFKIIHYGHSKLFICLFAMSAGCTNFKKKKKTAGLVSV